MSNLIPPLLSSSPPPIVGPLDEEDDDEFGDFRAAADSYDCDDFSLPSSPKKSPDKELKTVNLDINSNKSQTNTSTTQVPTEDSNSHNEVEKDFQDRRKSIEVNCSSSSSSQSEVSKTLDDSPVISDQNVDKTGSEIDDQDDSKDVHSEEPNSREESEDIGQVETNVEDENLFDEFSTPDKTNSDELSELNEINEIKSEADCLDEMNSEITDKEDKLNNSSKDMIYDLSESSMSLKVGETDPKLSDDEFGDFENHFGVESSDKQHDSDDDFDDFVNPEPVIQEDTADDDFGDFESSEFGEFSSQKSDFMDIDEKNAFERSETILLQIFPRFETDADYINETKENTVFHELKDITETNALIYQWSKSNSQKMFFKALNIDTRNILYGPAWNTSMPRFAANLGLTPLEPVKTEILTPTPVLNISSPSNSSQKSGDIPTAQFDWSGSGLINPLDYSQTMLLDLEQLVASLDIPPTTNPSIDQSPSPCNELLDEWDLWLQTTSTEPPSVPRGDSPRPNIAPYLPPTLDKQNSFPSLFDLDALEKRSKEPAPCENESKIEITKPPDDLSLFESPKLIPLRETYISTDLSDLSKPGWLQPTILTPDLPRKEPVINPDDDDEFDDFQMVLPEEKAEPKPISIPFEPKPVHKDQQNEEHIFGNFISSPVEAAAEEQAQEEEFTEFHSSAVQSEILAPLQPVPLEPLKPSIQYSQPAQINWPEPGVTEDEIRNIDLSYSRKSEPKNEPAKVDDEEWSDFVSVSNLPVKTKVPERTATPDLPLSVLNLNHVQAPRQPIPVITPSGLVQTKLASNVSKSVVQTSVHPATFRPPSTQFQPSIISNHFAAKFPTANDDDDDWSDFVSSQPQMNGFQQKPATNQKNPPNWTGGATTNIILNPTHFASLPSHGPGQSKKAAIPSISALPDLDFIAPKNRTSKK